jgi:hypothetical protein
MKNTLKPKTSEVNLAEKKTSKPRRNTAEWTAPPMHVQKVLRDAIVPYLRVINVFDIAKRSGDVNATRNFILKNIPIRSRETWVKMKVAVMEDVMEMNAFGAQVMKIKNHI